MPGGTAAAAVQSIVGLEDLPDGPEGLPIAVKQSAAVVGGVHTEIIVTKCGNLLQAALYSPSLKNKM